MIKFHICLKIKGELRVFMSLSPNPPKLMGRVTFVQNMLAIPFFGSVNQRKFASIEFKFEMTSVASLKTLLQYIIF